MGYISTQEVKEIRNKLKETFTSKEGFKLSVKRYHYSTVCVTILKSPLKFDSANKTVNDHFMNDIKCDNERVVFKLINTIIENLTGGQVNRNANDPGADYSDCNYYKDFSIGEYGKPCEFVGQ